MAAAPCTLPVPAHFAPPLLKNPLQKLFAGLVAAAFAAGEAGFGFYEAAFDGGFEDGGFVAFEVGLDALEVGDGFVEAGELLFDFGDDVALFVERRQWNQRILQEGCGHTTQPTAPVMCRAASLRNVALETK